MSLGDTIKNKLRPKLAQLVTSPKIRDFKRRQFERKRGNKGQPHKVVVFLRLNDAYSYVLLQTLKPLAERYPLQFEFRTVLNLQAQMYPAPLLWASNAFNDSRDLAQLYQLDFPRAAPPSDVQRDNQLTAQLLHWELESHYLNNALALFKAYWHDDSSAISDLINVDVCSHDECYQHHLQANENLLKQQGHYLSAMLHYGEEWYWGLDRLEHLEQRLNQLGLGSQPERIDYNLSHRDFCQAPATEQHSSSKPLVIYWSARSPYSYLGLVRARQLCQHYNIPLQIKPVLPMVMRRMQVPRTKGMYIMRDTKREAEKYGLDFGRVADPLGQGVERCYALFDYARRKGKAVAFAESFARGVWAEGIAADNDAGLEVISSRAGLDWNIAKPLLQDQSWRVWAQDNLAELYGNDLWGVPSFKYGELNVFGQDRLGRVEQAMIAELKI